jgi:hypothetical protein
MTTQKDLHGMKFGRLTATHLAGRANDGAFRWWCICECGKTKEVRRSDLLSGKSKSCGCRQAYGGRDMQKRIDELEQAFRYLYTYSVSRDQTHLVSLICKFHHDLFPELHKLAEKLDGLSYNETVKYLKESWFGGEKK